MISSIIKAYNLLPQVLNIATESINSVCYGPNGYIAVGTNSVCITSVDGVTWDETTNYKDLDINKTFIPNVIKYVDLISAYIIVGNNGLCLISYDGVTWTNTLNFEIESNNTTFHDIDSTNNIIIAVGSNGYCMTSTDGLTWTNNLDYKNKAGTTITYAITHSPTLIVAVGNNGLCMTSTDGLTWTKNTNYYSNAGYYAVVGSQTINVLKHAHSIAYNGSLFVALGPDGMNLVSSNGLIWYESYTSGTIFNLRFPDGNISKIYKVVAVGSTFVTASQITFITSTDGYTWRYSQSPYISYLSNGSWSKRSDAICMTYGGGKFVYFIKGVNNITQVGSIAI